MGKENEGGCKRVCVRGGGGGGGGGEDFYVDVSVLFYHFFHL